MKTVIAFVSDIEEELKLLWIDNLQQNLKNCKIVPFENLNKTEKENCKLAIVANPKPEEMKELKNLIWVQSLWAGVEKLLQDIPFASFDIVRMVDPKLADTMAESVLAWTMYLHKNMFLYKKQQEYKIWKQHIDVPAQERTVAVLGLGNLGLTSATSLKSNGFNVIGWSRSKKEIQGVTTYHGDEGLDRVLKNANIIVCLLPLTSETKNLLNKKRLDLLSPTSCVINFARALIFDYEYLLKKIENSEILHAVLDVFEMEPLPKNSELWQDENITVLPHISAPTNMKTASLIASSNISEYLEHEKLPIFINKETGY